MTIRYCGAGGNDANTGLSWAQRKLTLNGVEDTPVVAGDVCYIGPGVYRETLTCDVSGAVGSVITYIADVSGEHTDGIGGVVRISGSNNDQAAVRANNVVATSINYRTFRGFMLDGTSAANINTTSCTNWVVEDCTILDLRGTGVSFSTNSTGHIVRRCVFFGLGGSGVVFTNAIALDNSNNLVQNCVVIQTNGNGVLSIRVGGVSVRNCLFVGSLAVRVSAALSVGQTVTVNNSIFYACSVAFQATVLGELVENFNNVYACTTARTNVAVGAGSTAYPPVFQPLVLNSGVGQVSGFHLPWQFGALSSWSQIRAIAGASEATEDLFGLARPVAAALNSWGPIQFQQITQDTVTVRTGTLSQEFTTAGRRQIIIPVQAVNTTISVYVYREANYAGINPQMILKQSGQADIVVTDAGGLSAWNQLTHTWIPATAPPWIVIELVSNNTAVAGAFAVYFDDLTVSPLDTDTQEAWLTNEQPVNYAEELATASAAFSPVGGEIVGA